jgi:deoxyxylulose-5-phosphate synthase
VGTPALTFGMPAAFPEHGARASVLVHAGLSAQEIARRVTERVAAPLADLSDRVTPAQDQRG